MLLTGKIAIITGASTGIGKGIAQRFLKEGAKVIVFGRSKPDYPGAEFYKVDVSSENQIISAMKKIKKLDILVNNAGILFLENIENSTKNFDKTLDVNLKGQFWMCRHALPLLKKSKGNIVNISSVIGVMPASDAIAYCISKAGVISLTKNLAQQYAAQGIRVNAVLPGPIDTPMLRSTVSSEREMYESYARGNPMKRIGKPEDIAAAVAFLASNEARYITGISLPVDGGALGTSSGE